MTVTYKIPSWVEKNYAKLFAVFRENEFSREDAVKLLEQDGIEELTVNAILATLEKAGWLTIKISPGDRRRRSYKLKNKEQITLESLEIGRKIGEELEIKRSQIESLLKKGADIIRTRVDYKYLLILLFLKRISDAWESNYQRARKEALEAGLTEEEADREARSDVFHKFVLPEESRWQKIKEEDPQKLPSILSHALKRLADENKELAGVVDSVDFMEFTKSTENCEILKQLVSLFSKRNLAQVSSDMLGDAYEWVLRYFAPQKAKEGEVFTPREIISLLVEMLEPKPNEHIYDPACGSGGMLTSSYAFVRNKYGKRQADKLWLYGQEANLTIYALSKMNLYIHDLRDAEIRLGDTLLSPKFLENGGIKKFDLILINPPWNQDGYGESTLKNALFSRDIFEFGYPPNQSADWAWAQHIIKFSRKEKGRAGLVIDNGCLFRGGKERAIRSKIVEKDLIDCVILLPEKLFYNTGAPGAIILFNKNKPLERKNKVLFINASKEFISHPSVRRLNSLSKENIKKIADAYKDFAEVAGFSRAVCKKEIIDNDYNLNVSLYVMPIEEKEEIDVLKEFSELKDLEKRKEEVREKLEGYISELSKTMGG